MIYTKKLFKRVICFSVSFLDMSSTIIHIHLKTDLFLHIMAFCKHLDAIFSQQKFRFLKLLSYVGTF